MRKPRTTTFALLAVLASGTVASQACTGDATSPDFAASSSTSAATGGGGSGPGGQGGSGLGGEGGSNVGGGGAGGSGPTLPTNADCSPPSGPTGALTLAALPMTFSLPMGLVSPWGDAERRFVFERAGRIRLVKGGVASVFLDIHDKVRTDGEFGLLGIAFHPDYAKNGRFFVHYSAAATGATTIEEYRRDPNNPDLADPSPVGMPVLTVNQPASNHDGGTIEFSPIDGYLHIALGDGGGGCDTFQTGQNPDTLLAKILRIDVSTTPYSIPAGNSAMGRPETFISGLRNPFRTAFDICTGDLYIGDVGQGRREEIDVAPAGQSGLNFGWSVMEGSICANGPNGCNVACSEPVFDLPVADYTHEKGRCSVTGGRVYRGTSIPWLRGAYVYGDFCTGEIWSLRYQNGIATDLNDLTSALGGPLGQGLVSFGEDDNGEVYVVHLSGSVYRIEPKD